MCYEYLSSWLVMTSLKLSLTQGNIDTIVLYKIFSEYTALLVHVL